MIMRAHVRIQCSSTARRLHTNQSQGTLRRGDAAARMHALAATLLLQRGNVEQLGVRRRLVPLWELPEHVVLIQRSPILLFATSLCILCGLFAAANATLNARAINSSFIVSARVAG